jgi:hypothetical protein
VLIRTLNEGWVFIYSVVVTVHWMEQYIYV